MKYGPSAKAKGRKFYTMSFSVTFEYEDDKVWFAYTIPYTYSMLT